MPGEILRPHSSGFISIVQIVSRDFLPPCIFSLVTNYSMVMPNHFHARPRVYIQMVLQYFRQVCDRPNRIRLFWPQKIFKISGSVNKQLDPNTYSYFRLLPYKANTNSEHFFLYRYIGRPSTLTSWSWILNNKLFRIWTILRCTLLCSQNFPLRDRYLFIFMIWTNVFLVGFVRNLNRSK